LIILQNANNRINPFGEPGTNPKTAIIEDQVVIGYDSPDAYVRESIQREKQLHTKQESTPRKIWTTETPVSTLVKRR